MSTLSKDASANEMYEKIDEMPNSIKTIVEPTMNMNSIKRICLFLVILYVCSALFTYIESIAMTNVSNKFARSLRGRISKKNK